MPNVKGSALKSRFQFVEARYGSAGVDRLLGALPPEDGDLHAAGILVSQWYPFETFVRVMGTIDSLFGNGDLSLCIDMARYAADVNLTTLYRFFYRIGSVNFILGMAARLWRAHYDAGELAIRGGERMATLQIVDWPAPERAHCLSVMGWATRSVELSGGAGVRATENGCRARGDSVCEFSVTWR